MQQVVDAGVAQQRVVQAQLARAQCGHRDCRRGQHQVVLPALLDDEEPVVPVHRPRRDQHQRHEPGRGDRRQQADRQAESRRQFGGGRDASMEESRLHADALEPAGGALDAATAEELVVAVCGHGQAEHQSQDQQSDVIGSHGTNLRHHGLRRYASAANRNAQPVKVVVDVDVDRIGVHADRDGVTEAVHTVGQAHHRRQRREPCGEQDPASAEGQVGRSAVHAGHHGVAGDRFGADLRIELPHSPAQQRRWCGGRRGGRVGGPGLHRSVVARRGRRPLPRPRERPRRPPPPHEGPPPVRVRLRRRPRPHQDVSSPRPAR